MNHLLKIFKTILYIIVAASFCMPVFAQETIKIGLVAPMSGAFALYGQGFHQSMQAYMANYGDTVAGKKVEIIVRDNTTNTPETARRLAQELINRERVDFLAGFALSPDALSVATLSAQAKKPTIVMLAAASGLTAKSPYLVRVSYSNIQTSAFMAKWAYKNGVRKVYTMVSDYAPGIDCEVAFQKAFESLGGKIIGKSRMPLASLEYAPYVQRLKESSADAVYLFVPSGDPMVSFMKNYVERGLPQAGMKLLTTTDLAEEYIKPMGDAAAYITNTIQYYDTLSNEENAKFKTAYLKIAGKNPGAIALGGYDGMAVIYEVSRKLNGKLDPEKIMAAMKGLKIKSPRGDLMIDPDTRDAVANMYVAKIEKKGSQYVPVVIDTFVDVKEGK